MKIEILGSDCPACKKLLDLTRKAVLDSGLSVQVEYSTDIEKIIRSGAMSGPVLLVDGEIALSGYLPELEELEKIILSKKK